MKTEPKLCPECGKPLLPCRELHLLDFRDYQLVMYPDGLCRVAARSRPTPAWGCRDGCFTEAVDSSGEAEWFRARVRAVATTGKVPYPETPEEGEMKTREEIEAELAEIESDERLGYDLATIEVNALLALKQLVAKTKAGVLRWVLGLPYLQYHGQDEE
ncbi:hypothetical protein LCGC14_0259360 [marine sediment metagenome]|uniref:Uncharacterized protein n=1 Tax=marine sediment metagenome TaxID=412755 RepID=A0A0F9WMY0_9ZZZZ